MRTRMLKPPFHPIVEIAAFGPESSAGAGVGGVNFHYPQYHIQEALFFDLSPKRLNSMHRMLWLAGLPRPARPLHRQILLNRSIVITERPDEHLVWHESRIFLKPLPKYLLNFSFWERHLCTEKALFECASGLILSYVWLVRYNSDLEIALSTGLLPASIDWERWTAFVDSFLAHVNPFALNNVDRRYHFGELRLGRLDLLCVFEPSKRRSAYLIRGYLGSSLSNWSRAFVSKNFAWLFAGLFYITVICSALQVGLASQSLPYQTGLQKASYRFAIASVAGTLIVIGLIAGTLACLASYYIFTTVQYGKTVQAEREAARQLSA